MIKKYDTISDYTSDSTISTTESTVAFVADGTGTVVKGVNVTVEIPQKGDIAYLDKDRKLRFLLHDTYVASSFPIGSDTIGVVGEIVGNQAYIIAKDAYTKTAKWAAVYQWKVTAASSGNSQNLSLKHDASDPVIYSISWGDGSSATLQAAIQGALTANANPNWSCYIQDETCILQLDNYIDYRFAVSCPGIVFTPIMGDEVPAISSGSKMKNGNYHNNISMNTLATIEYASSSGTKTSDTEATSAYHDGIMSRTAFNNSTVMKNKYGTYEEYCASTICMVPRFDGKGPFSILNKGEEYTEALAQVTYTTRTGGTAYKYSAASLCYTYAPPVAAGRTVPMEYGSGKWHLPDMYELALLYRGMNTTNANTIPANYDVVNRNLAVIGTAISVTAPAWSCVRCSSPDAWYYRGSGYSHDYGMYASFRALPLLLITI